MSILLPHFLKEGRGQTRCVFHPRVQPDMDQSRRVLVARGAHQRGSQVGLHVALTPTWSETAWFADYVLPMGVAAPSATTPTRTRPTPHGGSDFASRSYASPGSVRRQSVTTVPTRPIPGEVWEENEFWIDLSWRIDPDGSMGIRRWFESPNDPTRPVTVDEYYGWMFDNSVPGLPEEAGAEGLYTTRIHAQVRRVRDRQGPLSPQRHGGGTTMTSRDCRGRTASGVTGFHHTLSPSRMALRRRWWIGAGRTRRSLRTSSRMCYWRRSGPRRATSASCSRYSACPRLIHTRGPATPSTSTRSRTGHPLWVNPQRRRRTRVSRPVRWSASRTDIGYFVMRAWRTEGIRPGVVAASHHLGTVAPQTTRKAMSVGPPHSWIYSAEERAGLAAPAEDGNRTVCTSDDPDQSSGSGGGMPVSTRTWRSRCIQTRSPVCMPGISG